MTRHKGHAIQLTHGLTLPGAEAAQQIISKSLDIARQEVLLEASKERDQLLAQAQQILANARQQATAMVTQGVESLMEQTLAEARDEGFKAGYEAGMAQLKSDTLALVDGANQIVDKACFAEQRRLHQFKTTAAELMLTLSQQVFGRALWDDPTLLLDLLESAIDQLALSTTATLVISQDLHQHLKSAVKSDTDLAQRFNRLVWIADPQLEPAQVFLQSNKGHFDLSPDTQVKTLLAHIKPMLPNGLP
jgi:flagellar assembly protein FliH